MSHTDSQPTQTFTKLKRYTTLAWHYLKPLGPQVSLMALLLLSSVGLQLILPSLLRTFIDQAQDGATVGYLTRIAFWAMGAAIGAQLLSIGSAYLITDVGWKATNALRHDLAKHTLTLNMAFHHGRTPGEMIERIDGDVIHLSNFFSQFSVRVLSGLIMFGGILVLMWFESPLIGSAMSAFAILTLLLMLHSSDKGMPASEAEREANAQIFSFIEERLTGLDDLRANGGGLYSMWRFQTVAWRYIEGTVTAWMVRMRIWVLSIGLFGLAHLLALGFAGWLYLRGEITLGTAYLIMQYMLMIETPIEQITEQMQELQRAGASIARVDELLGTQNPIITTQPSQATTPAALPAAHALNVSFNEVSFAYETQPVLQDVSFYLPAGRTLGIVGRTGSGKSTLMRLLFRFYDPQQGHISLGGHDLRTLPLHTVRNYVGFVTQDVQLFHASVRDNLTFFDPSVPDEALLHALKQVGLSSWLSQLPEGLESIIEAGGNNVSAGEAQLLALGRVFLKDPKVVVLDEPTSRLDPASEVRLEHALDTLLQGRTVLMIAHRLQSLERADEIMVMHNGQIIEYGIREQLAQSPSSHYAKLLQAQHSKEDAASWKPEFEYASS